MTLDVMESWNAFVRPACWKKNLTLDTPGTWGIRIEADDNKDTGGSMRGKSSNTNHRSSQVISSEEIHKRHTFGKLDFLRNTTFHFNEFFLERFLREGLSTIPNERFARFFLTTLEDQPTWGFADEEENAEEDGGEEKVASERNPISEF
jgi:hypothetical protein